MLQSVQGPGHDPSVHCGRPPPGQEGRPPVHGGKEEARAEPSGHTGEAPPRGTHWVKRTPRQTTLRTTSYRLFISNRTSERSPIPFTCTGGPAAIGAGGPAGAPLGQGQGQAGEHHQHLHPQQLGWKWLSWCGGPFYRASGVIVAVGFPEGYAWLQDS